MKRAERMITQPLRIRSVTATPTGLVAVSENGRLWRMCGTYANPDWVEIPPITIEVENFGTR